MHLEDKTIQLIKQNQNIQSKSGQNTGKIFTMSLAVIDILSKEKIKVVKI